MALTTAGRNFIATAIVNSGTPTFYTNAAAYTCVGDTATAYSAADTDMKAPTNKLRKAMDVSYPTIATNVITFQSTFASGDANFAWEEWGIANAASAGCLLNRKVESNGTKASGQTWVFQTQLTISIGS